VLATASTVPRPSSHFASVANVGRFGGHDLMLNAQQSVEVARMLSSVVGVPVRAEGWGYLLPDRNSRIRGRR